MYVAFYRWKLKPGSEKVFEEQWEKATVHFREEHKALGSRLHQADDGTWFAYAQWPSREVYHAKREPSSEHRENLNKMSECVLESFTPILGDVTCDLLVKINNDDSKNLEITLPDFTIDTNLREDPVDAKQWQVFLDSLKTQLSNEVNLSRKLKLYEFIGLACRVLLKLDEAEYYLLKACELSTGYHKSRLVQNQNRLAHVYQWKKEFQKAHLLFDQIQLSLNENSFSEILVAACHQHLGKLYFDQDFYRLALAQFNLALKMRLRQKASPDQVESTELAITETRKRLQFKNSEKVVIRRAEVNDAEAIHNAHMKSIKEICSKDHDADEIRVWSGRAYNPNFRIPPIKEQFVLVAEVDGAVEGFCHLKIGFTNNQKSAHLFGLYITPKILKKNIGGEIVQAVFEYCKCHGVKEITLTSSLTAFDFYKKQGFIQSGELSGVVIEGVKIRGYPMRVEV